MRVNNIFSGRPAYYDRNGTRQALTGGGDALGPHALTTRFTYTVPSGRKFFLGRAHLITSRELVATTVGDVQMALVLNGSNAAKIISNDNTVGVLKSLTPGGGEVFAAGDTIAASTLDNSTGGGVNYHVGGGGVEFDA